LREKAMPSPFMGIDIASRALRAFQQSLNVTGHNISNANTAGYSRQTADLQSTDPTVFYCGKQIMLGTGVSIASVNRIRDMFLEGRRIDAQSEASRLDTLTTNLKRVETIFVEPGEGGISDALNEFYNACSALASNPNEDSMRFQVQTSGQLLADRIRGTYLDLNAVKDQFTGDIGNTFDQIDQLTSRIAELNGEIREKTALGAEPNDLLDMRDQAIQDLSGLVNITTYQCDDGTMAIYTGQRTLVDSSGSIAIPRTYDAATQTITDGTFTYKVSEGKLSGLFQSVNTIESYQSQLDSLANNLRTQVNSIHQTGTNNQNPPVTNINFFNDVATGLPQSGAIDFDLSAEVKADPDAIAAGVTGNAGDGGLALSLSQLRESPIAALGNKTFGEYYTNLASSIGRDVQSYGNALDSKTAVLDQIDTQIQSVSGVSLDDEMANMLRYQRSYQAAAKMLSIFDQTTEDLINMLRV
jgi:flagellar hook-associated protein 1